jgi:hypothetical protein
VRSRARARPTPAGTPALADSESAALEELDLLVLLESSTGSDLAALGEDFDESEPEDFVDAELTSGLDLELGVATSEPVSSPPELRAPEVA